MAYQFNLLFADFTEKQIKDHFDDDASRTIMEMEPPCEALMKSKTLKQEGNKLFKARDYGLALNVYENPCRFFVCLFP